MLLFVPENYHPAVHADPGLGSGASLLQSLQERDVVRELSRVKLHVALTLDWLGLVALTF